MKLQRILIILFLTLNLISCKSTTVESQIKNQESSKINKLEFPNQLGFVNDFEDIFTKEQNAFLTNLLKYYQETSNREITIITIEFIPEKTDFMQYAIGLANNWKVGENNNGNGLTIVLSKTLRKIRISTTTKTQYYYLSDKLCQKVVDEIMIPEFKKEKYYDGLLLGLNELIKKWI